MDRMYILNLIRWVARALFVILNNLYCIPTYCVWMYFVSAVRVYSEELFWQIEGQCFYWLLTMVAFWSYSAGYNIVETGDDINPIINDECMVLVNHQSTSDVPLLMAAFSTRNYLLQNLSWIMDGVFKYTNFGIVSMVHGDFFIAAGRDKRAATLIMLKEYLKKIYVTRHRKWIVLFPEGGFLRKRREAGHRYARRLNLPLLNYVTLPRLGAIQAIMDTIGPRSSGDNSGRARRGKKPKSGKLKYVIDMTIAYPNGNPLDLGSVICGYDDACDVRMHYRVFPIADVPSDPDELQDWTYKRYIEKEALLEYYYKTGIWEPRVLDFNYSRTFSSLSTVAQGTDPDATRNNSILELFVRSESQVRQSGLMGSVSSLAFPNSSSEMLGVTSSVALELSNSVVHTTLLNSVVARSQTDTENEPEAPSNSENVDVENIFVGSQQERNVTENQSEEDALVRDSLSLVDIESVFSFPSPPEEGRVNHQDLVRIGIIHVGFICSTAFHIWAGFKLCYFCKNSLYDGNW